MSGLLNNLKPDTVKTIKQSYFFLVFVLTMIGMYIGYDKGRNIAKIKSPPLAENVRDLFHVDINREKSEGRFGKMQETELINEMKKADPEKIQFLSRELLKPELEHRIIEPEREKKISRELHPDPIDRQIEGSYREINKLNPEVKQLRGTNLPGSGEREIKSIDKSLMKDNKALKDLPEEKVKTEKSRIKLEPIKKGSEIIEK